MKHRIRKLCSLLIALSMLLSLMPLYGAAADDEFSGYETLDEVPFEFELGPGDLPFEQLKDAVLSPEDIPSCIAPALIEERCHVNRLYLQEPDDYTVMFQNRDGSKTVYVFSHPVKGMTMTTAASIQVSGAVVSFAATNAITSRIAELTSFNIGSAEIAYIPTGILSSDGIDLTEDARGWADGESTAAALSYNISSEAAAEYAASVAVPDTEAASVNATAPGVTITPITPAPMGGMTVMSISYSDLAGVMSFKSASSGTNKYLTTNPSVTNSILVANRIILPLSQWVVEYNSDFGYTVANLYQPANKYLGLDENGDFAVTSLDNMLDAFTIDIVSSSDSEVKVTISCGSLAIDSTASTYLNDPDAASFPTSCEWIIKNKTDYEPVQSITSSRIRTVYAGEPFYAEYTTTPATPTYSDIELYFASNDQTLPNDSDYDYDDYTAYVITEPGTYQVYYKDSSSGVKSATFWLNVVQNVTGITPASSVRIEQSGVGFYLDYTVTPELANNYSISLYYASNGVEVDYEEDEDGEPDYYYIDTPGIYTVYYMDSVSGVRSENFLLVITEVDEENDFASNKTYSIRPVNAPTYYLSMSGNSVDENGNNSIGVSAITCNTTTSAKTTIANSTATTYISNHFERWNNISKLFTFEQVEGIDSTYKISAILCTEQATIPTGTISASDYIGPDYVLREETLVPNTICYSDTDVQTKKRTDEDNDTQIIVCNMGTYYVLLCYNEFDSTNATIKALKYFDGDVSIAEYCATDTSFHWYISHVGVNAPLIMQTRKNSCGYTNVLQVLYGKGVEEVAVGSDLDEQIEYIADEYGTQGNSANSTYVYSNILTELAPDSSFTATRYYINHPSHANNIGDKESMIEKIENSLDLGWAPMILTYAGNAPYKEGYNSSFAHFVCIIGYDENSDTIIISNCHYTYDPSSMTENDKLFGVFAIDADDFYAAVAYLYVMS